MVIGSEAYWTPPSAWQPNPQWWHADQDDPDAAETEVSYLVRALIRATQPEIVVESGTATGVTAELIGKTLLMNGHGHLWTVEIDAAAAAKAAARVQGLPVTVVHADTMTWNPATKVDFAWIDSGDAATRVQEIRNWWRLFSPGALIGIHDTAPNQGREVLAGLLDEFIDANSVFALWLRTPRGVTFIQVPG